MPTPRSQGESDRPTPDRALVAIALLAALLAASTFAYLASRRPSQDHLWGDEGTYIAMTASLARDGDLIFAEPDRDWALERGARAQEAERRAGRVPPPGTAPKGVTVILQRTGAGITYSKPLLYPLLAALPYKLLGETGMLLVNALALAFGLLMVALFLGRLGSGGHRWLTFVTFSAFASLAPYLAWRMSESLQLGLAMGALVLACGGLRERADGATGDRLDHRAAPWLGGALLATLTAMRTSNALLLVGAVAACLLVAGRKRALAVLGGAAVGLAVVLTVSQIGLGTISPYTAERASFNSRIGYPVGADAAEALKRFEERPATHRPHLDLSPAQRYSALYFLVGRHTGLLAYFPLSLVLVALLLRRPTRLGLTMLATTLAMAAFYLLYTPHNYFGGSTFVGNRYFLVAYPALLLGLSTLPPVRLLLAVLAVGSLFGVSAVGSVRLAADLDGTSQSHTSLGAFRRLPYETTAREIQGQRYRFWSGDYLRFTDHWVDVERRRFVLHSDRPHSEVMLARSLVPPRTYFLVRPAHLADSLSWRSGGVRGWQRPAVDPDRPGIVSIETGRTWRQHPLGWSSRADYDLRMLELRLEAEEEPERAELYYLGGGTDLLTAFPPEVVAVELPEEGQAGAPGLARLTIRNSSGVFWSPDDVLPITVVCRLSLDDEEISRVQRPIEEVVGPGRETTLELAFAWPDVAGDYRLSLDVTQHPIRSVTAGEILTVVEAAP